MTKKIPFWIAGLLLLVPAFTQAQVNVTFRVNAALFSDTLKPNHVVQFRGGLQGETGSISPAITWDATSPVLENIGGDYWTITLSAPQGTAINYKYWAGATLTKPLINKSFGFLEEGWDSGPNRTVTFQKDTVITDWLGSANHFSPIPEKEDSIAVHFKVNVGYQAQSGLVIPGTTVVTLRGGLAPLPADWQSGPVLTYNPNVVGNNHFYSATVYFPKPTGSPVELPFKFFAAEWESGENRSVQLQNDTTLHWVNFSNQAPLATSFIDKEVTFRVNMGAMQLLNFFDPTLGDRVTIRGGGAFGGWAESFDDANQLLYNEETADYSVTKLINGPVGQQTAYKFFIDYHPSRADESSPNFLNAFFNDNNFGYEEPTTLGGGNRVYTLQNDGDEVLPRRYFNDMAPSAVILKENIQGNNGMVIRFTVDMSPALDLPNRPFNPATDSVYFQLQSRVTIFTLGLTNHDLHGRFEHVGSNIYTYDLSIDKTTINEFGYNVLFGNSSSPLVFSGNGSFDEGRRYYQYVQPLSVGAKQEDELLGDYYPAVWPAFYAMKPIAFTTGNATVEPQPDYAALSGTVMPPAVPSNFEVLNDGARVLVKWKSVNSGNLTSHKIYRGAAANSVTLLATVQGTDTMYVDHAVQTGTYFYTVSAVNSAGLESSQTSAKSVSLEIFPDLKLVAQQHVTVGDTVDVQIRMGDGVPVNNLFGLRFLLNWNGPAAYVSGSAKAGNFFPNPKEVLFIPVDGENSIDLAVTALQNSGSAKGAGEVARLRFVTTNAGQLSFSFSQVVAKDTLDANVALRHVHAGTQVRPTISANVLLPTVGIPGQEVSIKGFGFGVTQSSQDRRVKFGPKTATVIAWSDTLITFSVPDSLANGTYPVSIAEGANVITTELPFHYLNAVAVWPGDTNNDGAVNGIDLLPIGRFYNQQGPSVAPGTMWQVYKRMPWGMGTDRPNRIFADANGDGKINSDDILPIAANYGLAREVNTTKQPATVTNPLAVVGKMRATGDDLEIVFSVIGNDLVAVRGLSMQMSPKTALSESTEISVSGFADLAKDPLTISRVLSVENRVDFAMASVKSVVAHNGELARIVIKGAANLADATKWDISGFKAIDNTGRNYAATVVLENAVMTAMERDAAPKTFGLAQNYPNPFNPSTRIAFDLPEASMVSLKVFDLQGRLVRDLIAGSKAAGSHTVTFNAEILANGVYLYRLEAVSASGSGGYRQTRKMILVK